ncbi:hypothetical protein G3I15_33650 [Streptomyces sp. SID10244]|nr:hypothetical protein [Streptomyces sp. SID10244]
MVDGIDEEFAEIVGLVGERRAQMIVVAAAAVAGDIRADADQLGTAHVEDATRASLRVLGALPPVTVHTKQVLALPTR